MKNEQRTVQKKKNAKVSNVGGSSYSCRVCLFFSACLTAAVGIIVLVPGRIDAVVIDLHPCEDDYSNTHLQSAVKLFEGELVGPEAFAVDSEGNMYTGLSDGRIVQFNDTTYTTVVRMGLPPYDSCGPVIPEHRCGRPLGLEIHPLHNNLLYIAESYHGIYQYNLQTEELKLLVNTSDLPHGYPAVKFVNDLVVLKNGSIFFTDTSTRFNRAEVIEELYEGRATGKLLHYNPSIGTVDIVATGLAFANGLYLSTKENFVLISESTACRITKYYLTGPKAGTTEPFIKGLPGVPDNISPSSSGGLWVGFGDSRRSGAFDMLSKQPLIRNIIIKLHVGRAIIDYAIKDGMIIEYNEDGEKVRGLYDLGGWTIAGVSEVLDTGSTLYLGSFDAPYLAKVQLDSLLNESA